MINNLGFRKITIAVPVIRKIMKPAFVNRVPENFCNQIQGHFKDVSRILIPFSDYSFYNF